MSNYELMFIISSVLTDEERVKVLEEFKALLTSFGATVNKESEQGKKKFAYPIKKQSEGEYFVYNISMPKDKLIELQKDLNVSKTIIRAIIIDEKEL